MKIAIAQYAPNPKSIADNLKLIDHTLAEAAKEKVEFITFGETWLSGYPAWLDHGTEVAHWDHEPVKEAYLELKQNSLKIPSLQFEKLCKMCKKHKISMVIGVNEACVDKNLGTLFNSLLTIGKDGNVLNHHRKLMPTFTEKLLYGLGDGNGLGSVSINNVRISSAICWEHWMPMTRQALHNSGEHLHVAVWPWVHEKHLLASRHYAFEGKCYVMATGQLMKFKDFPESIMLDESISGSKDTYVLKGNSCIIDPKGDIIEGPLYETEGLIIADIDSDMAEKEKMNLDVSAHYNRPDVFSFTVNKDRS